MRLITVVHGDKVEGLNNEPLEIAANPSLTIEGMKKILSLLAELKPFKPFSECYSSYAARALDTASVLCLACNLDLWTMRELTAHSNKDKNRILYYPGYSHENENFTTLQDQAVKAAHKIWIEHEDKANVLAVTHGPHIAGLIGRANGVNDEAGLGEILKDFRSSTKGFVVFEIQAGSIKTVG